VSDDNETSLESLMIELVTASNDADSVAFIKYVHQCLDDELSSQAEAYELIVLFAEFGGKMLRAWAEDTDRDPETVLQVISLAMYKDDGT